MNLLFDEVVVVELAKVSSGTPTVLSRKVAEFPSLIWDQGFGNRVGRGWAGGGGVVTFATCK